MPDDFGRLARASTAYVWFELFIKVARIVLVVVFSLIAAWQTGVIRPF